MTNYEPRLITPQEFSNFLKNKMLRKESSIEAKQEEAKKFADIKSQQASSEVWNYLSTKLQYLTIKVENKDPNNIFNLMQRGILEGWCWETTETAIMLLENEDYIERGILKFHQYKNYEHSWICFRYQGMEYIFDPYLNFLCEKEIYTKIFEANVKASVTAEKVQDEFITMWINSPKKDEILVIGNDDINSPMYRNYTVYQPEIENGKVKKLSAYYYKRGY